MSVPVAIHHSYNRNVNSNLDTRTDRVAGSAHFSFNKDVWLVAVANCI